MGKIQLFVVVGLGFVLVLGFQNCGKGFDASSTSSSLSIVGSEAAPDPSALPPAGFPMFQKGDAFNYRGLPAIYQSQMVETMLSGMGYASHSGPKAVAITATGLGYSVRKNSGNQIDANMAAIEGCFAISGGQRCALVAEGNTFAVGIHQLPTSFTFEIPSATGLTVESLPFILKSDRAAIVNAYNSTSGMKALAVSVDGSFVMIPNPRTSSGAGAASNLPASNAEAVRLALEGCEMLAAITPCTLVAEGSGFVFNPTQLNRKSKIDFSVTSLANPMPTVSASTYLSSVQPYANYVVQAGAQFGALYISATGAGGGGYGATQAEADMAANATCSSNSTQLTIGPDNPEARKCVKYVAKNSVVWTPDTALMSRRYYSAEVHCKAVPRFSCDDHRNLGCTAGRFYTTQTGRPDLESCP